MKARQIVDEAVGPREFIKQARQRSVFPGRDYYLAMAKPPLKIKPTSTATEYCPVEITSEGRASPMDGMYGLIDEAYTFLKIKGDGTDEEQERASDIVEHYEGGALQAIEKGTLRGIIDGPLGPREWALVYWPYQGNRKDVPPVFAELGKVYAPTED